MGHVTYQNQRQSAVASGTRIIALTYYSTCSACLLIFAAHCEGDLVDQVFLFFMLFCLGVGGWPISMVAGDLIASLACQLAGESSISPAKFAVVLTLTLSVGVISWVMVLILGLNAGG